MKISRRTLLLCGTGVGLAAFAFSSNAQLVYKEVSELLPGQFTWTPEREPEGPVAIVVSLPQQLVHVYRNGIRIAVSTCSTGKPGHGTPTGVFSILQKDADHRSSTYNNAPMPNMNRLTWSGIALHAGNLPGYPASHGCVRLPLEFSRRLFGITHIGTPVIIAGSHSDPWELTHPGMVLSGYAENEFEEVVASLNGKSHPSDWPDAGGQPITTLIASSQDRQILLLENGDELAKGQLIIDGPETLGEHVLVLNQAHEGTRGMMWQGVSHHEDPAYPHNKEENIINRVSADDAFLLEMKKRLHPGMVLIITDVSLHPDRRSGTDFVIMDTV